MTKYVCTECGKNCYSACTDIKQMTEPSCPYCGGEIKEDKPCSTLPAAQTPIISARQSQSVLSRRESHFCIWEVEHETYI